MKTSSLYREFVIYKGIERIYKGLTRQGPEIPPVRNIEMSVILGVRYTESLVYCIYFFNLKDTLFNEYISNQTYKSRWLPIHSLDGSKYKSTIKLSCNSLKRPNPELVVNIVIVF